MRSVSRAAALLLSLFVHALTLAFMAVGCWIIWANARLAVFWLIGLLLIGIGVLLLPRARRLPADAEVLGRSAAPELYAAAERVARAMGVEPPETLAVCDLAVATEVLRAGRRRVLLIGLPPWLVLSPRQRVVLLARAYAAEPDDGRIVGGALAGLAVWRESLLRGKEAPGRSDVHTRIGATLGSAGTPSGAYAGMGTMGRGLGAVLGLPVLALEWALTRLVQAARGDAAAEELQRVLRVATDAEPAELDGLLRDGRFLAPVQAAALRGQSAAEIRAAARDRTDAGDRADTPAPEDGLLTAGASERIDAELSGHFARAIKGFGLIS